MTENQRFRKKLTKKLHNFSLIIVSGLYVATLTAIAMKLVSLLTSLLFRNANPFAHGLEICSHLVAVLSFLASVLTDVFDQLEDTRLGCVLNRWLPSATPDPKSPVRTRRQDDFSKFD
jgi:hypothetical protein